MNEIKYHIKSHSKSLLITLDHQESPKLNTRSGKLEELKAWSAKLFLPVKFIESTVISAKTQYRFVRLQEYKNKK